MKQSTSLISYGNTYNPCLLLLREKGYELAAEDTGERMLWYAHKSEHTCMATSPPELLGIVVLWESFGQDWNKQHPNLLGELCEQASD